jgi:hypothetical protein
VKQKTTIYEQNYKKKVARLYKFDIIILNIVASKGSIKLNKLIKDKCALMIDDLEKTGVLQNS